VIAFAGRGGLRDLERGGGDILDVDERTDGMAAAVQLQFLAELDREDGARDDAIGCWPGP